MASGTLNTRPTLLHSFGTVTGTTIGVINAFGSSAFAGQPAVPAANQKWGIYRMLVTLSAAATVTIQDTVPTSLSQAFQLPANGSIALDVSGNGDPWWQASANGLGGQLLLSASVTCGFDVWWMPTV